MDQSSRTLQMLQTINTGTVVSGGEYDGKLGVYNNDGTPGAQYYANLADDLPSTYPTEHGFIVSQQL